jgi:hypothetical protein
MESAGCTRSRLNKPEYETACQKLRSKESEETPENEDCDVITENEKPWIENFERFS